jgi:hypothetical protein
MLSHISVSHRRAKNNLNINKYGGRRGTKKKEEEEEEEGKRRRGIRTFTRERRISRG